MTPPPDTALALDARSAEMREPPGDAGLEFHAITLTADDLGRVTLSTDTLWAGWHGEDKRIELRQSRIVDARYGRLWDTLGHPYHFVMSDDDLLVFLVAGGHALVERTVAESAFPELAEPQIAYPSGRSGFVDPGLLEAGADRRAPSPKTRMAVLKRDRMRCRICGRRPDDDVDIVLHVHHIRPWARGGATEMSNLITLCHTCHNGLDPHFERGLFDYVEPSDATTILSRFAESVSNYRRASAL